MKRDVVRVLAIGLIIGFLGCGVINSAIADEEQAALTYRPLQEYDTDGDGKLSELEWSIYQQDCAAIQSEIAKHIQSLDPEAEDFPQALLNLVRSRPTQKVTNEPLLAASAQSANPVGTEYYIWALGYDSNQCYRIDSRTGEIVASIPISSNPWSIVATYDGKFAYIVHNLAEGVVTKIDTATNENVKTISGIANYPYGSTITLDTLYVAGYTTGAVWTIKLPDDTIGYTIPLSGRVYDVNTVITGSNLGYLFSTVGAPRYEMAAVNLATGETHPVGTGKSPWSVVANPQKPEVYVTNIFTGKIIFIDTSVMPPSISGGVSISGWPNQMAVTPDGSKLLVTDIWYNKVVQIDTAGRQISGEVALGEEEVWSITVPDNKTAFVGYLGGVARLKLASAPEVVEKYPVEPKDEIVWLCTFYIMDTVPPLTAVKIEPEPNKNNWNNTVPVQVTLRSEDQPPPPISGVDYLWYQKGEDEPVKVSATEYVATAEFTFPEEGVVTLTYYAVDNAYKLVEGYPWPVKIPNVEETKKTPIQIDLTKPAITPVISPEPDGWTNTDVTISFEATDKLSGIDTVTPPVVFPDEGEYPIEITGTAVDKAGNIATTTVTATLKIDKTPPVIVYTISPSAPDATGWYKVPVTVSFSATDSLSGIATISPQNVTLGEGANQTVICTAVDKAGNPTTLVTPSINVDWTPPVIAVTIDPPQPNAKGWYKELVTVTFRATDAISGVDTYDPAPPVKVFGEGKKQSFRCTVTDKAGNSATSESRDIYVDLTPPDLKVPDPIVVLSAADPEIAKFLKSASAKDDLSKVKDPPGVTNDAPATFPVGVTTTVRFTATDNADNPGFKESTVTIVIVNIWNVIRSQGIPFSLPPTKNYDVNVAIIPSLPGGHNIKFDVIDGNGNNGTASVTANATRTTSGTVTVTGGNQTKPGHAGNLKIRGQLDGKIQAALSTGFSVCAHPTNYHQIQSQDQGDGTLYFVYQWTPDSGVLSHLDEVRIGEYVDYIGPPPNPPFINWPFVDPTYWDFPASLGNGMLNDSQLIGGAISEGPSATFSATQHYRYHCNRCMGPGGNPSNLNWGIILMGPIPITRYVEFINNIWRYRITKSGVEATHSLPYP